LEGYNYRFWIAEVVDEKGVQTLNEREGWQVTEDGEKAIGIGVSESEGPQRGEIRASQDTLEDVHLVLVTDGAAL